MQKQTQISFKHNPCRPLFRITQQVYVGLKDILFAMAVCAKDSGRQNSCECEQTFRDYSQKVIFKHKYDLVISTMLDASPMISTKAIRQTRQTSQLNKCVFDCRLVSLSSHFHRVTCHVHVLSNYNSSNKGVKFVETCQDGDVLIYTTCFGSNIFFALRLK